MNSLARDVIALLRDDYDIVGEFAMGGKHGSIRFVAPDGKRCRLTIANSPSDNDALKVKFGDVRRLLGPPPPRNNLKPQKRSLESMTAALEARAPTTSYQGQVSLIAKIPPAIGVRLIISIPDDLYRAFGYKGGLRIAKVEGGGNDDAFTVAPRPGFKSPRFFKGHNDNGWQVVSERTVRKIEGEGYGLSPAEFVLVDGVILVTVPFATRCPYRRHPARAIVMPPATIITPPPTAIITSPPEAPTREEMRAAIALIRRVEATTEYRLVRVKDGVEGHWAFSAPRIE